MAVSIGNLLEADNNNQRAFNAWFVNYTISVSIHILTEKMSKF